MKKYDPQVVHMVSFAVLFVLVIIWCIVWELFLERHGL